MNRLVEINQATFTIDQSEVKPEPIAFFCLFFRLSSYWLLVIIKANHEKGKYRRGQSEIRAKRNTLQEARENASDQSHDCLKFCI